MSSTRNGAVILKSFADLSQHIDVESLPPGPADTDESGPIALVDATPANSHERQETLPSFSPWRRTPSTAMGIILK